MKAIPGPAGHPVHGHAEEFRADPLAFLQRHHARWGELFRFRDGLTHHVVVSGLADIPAILNSAHAFTDGALPHHWGAAYECSVARIEGEAHRTQRRLLQPAFGKARVEALAAGIEPLLALCGDAAEATRAPAWPAVKALAFECLVGLLLGRQGSARVQDLARVMSVIEAWFGGVAMDPLAFSQAEAEFESLVLSIAALRRAEAAPRANPGRGSADLLDCLLLHLDEQSLVDEVAMMLITHIPTAQVLHHLWRQLADEPDRRARARAQVEAAAGSAELLPHQLDRAPLLGQLSREALRLHPPVWTLARRALRDWPIGRHVIAEGTQVLISPYLLQRSPRHWPEPERFAPERFDPRSPLHAATPRGAFMPFGAGQRKCIGERLALQLMGLATAAWLRRGLQPA